MHTANKSSKTPYFQKYILDLLFPPKCGHCEKIGRVVCPDCFSKIAPLTQQNCPYCEKIGTKKGEVCHACKNKRAIFLDGLVSASEYKEPLKSLIHKFKYSFIKELGLPLGEILSTAFRKNNLTLPDIVMSVPLHPIRERLRGFNQSEILAESICQQIAPGFEVPLSLSLKRKRLTFSQGKIKNFKERQSNMKNAFNLENSREIGKKHILLIDDVATTGATLFECARVLKKGGAKKVSALVLARQKIQD